MSIPCAKKATMIGVTMPRAAAMRNRRRRIALVVALSRARRGQTSWEIVPEIDTSRPEEVERNAAKAPAAVTAAEHVADGAGPRRLRQAQHDGVG